MSTRPATLAPVLSAPHARSADVVATTPRQSPPHDRHGAVVTTHSHRRVDYARTPSFRRHPSPSPSHPSFRRHPSPSPSPSQYAHAPPAVVLPTVPLHMSTRLTLPRPHARNADVVATTRSPSFRRHPSPSPSQYARAPPAVVLPTVPLHMSTSSSTLVLAMRHGDDDAVTIAAARSPRRRRHHPPSLSCPFHPHLAPAPAPPRACPHALAPAIPIWWSSPPILTVAPTPRPLCHRPQHRPSPPTLTVVPTRPSFPSSPRLLWSTRACPLPARFRTILEIYQIWSHPDTFNFEHGNMFLLLFLYFLSRFHIICV
jgi:hypothetical protein